MFFTTFVALGRVVIPLIALPHVTCKVHHIFVGNLDLPKSLYALSFDTETHNLTLTKNITAHARHHWLTLSHDRRNLYATAYSSPNISSYSIIENGTNVRLDSVISSPSTCAASDSSANLVALNREPYSVYSASWPGKPACASIYSTSNGTLSSVEHGYFYGNDSSVHGLALHPSGNFLYAADLNGDAMWTHALSPNGSITNTIRKDVSWDGKHPRHVATHPNGKWLYALMEASNSISAYPITELGTLQNTTSRYSLLPGSNYTSEATEPMPPLDDRYWSAEITVSPSSRILWGTARAQINATYVGYISAFLLSPSGSIMERLFIVPTTTVGGNANSVSMAPDTDEYVAMTDWKTSRRNGYVQMWQRVDKRDVTLRMRDVAKVDIEDGGCCANVVWAD
ncbi:3-carboxy-cis,cis-mucoante lactonizing enzyme [Amniculicola lignicola CBS 123094]|uniref:3-carboxy-cis,cis-mucoante lactonizing enzyme n=1 Tax=Amniculicola lignicola CBS 123094 TaxID=1392246 RepID=A0A6A5VX41_9PLEO|nr:3-carboxy-cis,cis-mucoante lactonizing enzyme [Amniculicola lignicola CBS 123094]